MRRRTWLAVPTLALAAPWAARAKSVPTYRFGILVPDRNGNLHLSQETTRIPRRYKGSGLRFGVEFTNWDRAPLDWYEVIQAPGSFAQVTGNTIRTSASSFRSKTLHTDEARIVDDHWIDEGDPLGRYRPQLFVNDARVYAVDFDLVSD